MVGRASELARLNEWFTHVKAKSRRVIFVSGEPGIGKTTLTRAFLDFVASDRGVRAGRGQCVEQYGAGEPYMPILEALTRLCREPGGDKIIEILHRLAPAWLAQMPSLVGAEDRARLQGLAQGTTQRRMLREMAEALEVIAADSPLVMFLEDLHWSDPSTLDLIATVARRSEPAHLMILGTYRPVEMLAGEHPLRAMKAELELHRQAIELRLPLLSEGDVGAYLQRRFTVSGIPRATMLPVQSDGVIDTAETLARGNDKKGSTQPKPSVKGEVSFPRAGNARQSASGAEQASLRAASRSNDAARGISDSAKLAQTVYARSEGNPLYMVNVVDYLIEQRSFADADKIEAPHNIRQMIERNLQRLSPDEQRVLEAASAAGNEFSAAAVAAALERQPAEVEACCVALSQCEQFVRTAGRSVWPDGTVASRYQFHHALYRETLYARLPAGHAVQLHRGLAGRMEAAYDGQVNEIAAELADHYRRANEANEAARYFHLAAQAAVEQRAYREAHKHYQDALLMLESMADSAERDRKEIVIRAGLADSSLVIRGYGAVEYERQVRRRHELAQRLGDPPQIFYSLVGLSVFSAFRLELDEAQAIGRTLLEIADQANNPDMQLQAHGSVANILWLSGDIVGSLEHAEKGLRLFEPDWRLHYSIEHGRASCQFYACVAKVALGFLDQGLRRATEYLVWAKERELLIPLGIALDCAATVSVWRREGEQALQYASDLLELATENGFAHWHSMGQLVRGRALALLGKPDDAIVEIETALESWEATGAVIPGWARANLAFALLAARQFEKGLTVVAKALEVASRTGDAEAKPELHWLNGLLLLNDPKQIAESETAFRAAVELSREASAKSTELRAATSLARLLRDTGRRDEARTELAEIYGWFTEGFDTRDLKDAKALLDELGVAAG
jgi:tetratricopeptide (TPR) repeat protein